MTGNITVYDRVADTTTSINPTWTGEPLDKDAYLTSFTPDGRYLCFSSWASNVVPGDTDRCEDVFVYDLVAGTASALASARRARTKGPVLPARAAP